MAQRSDAVPEHDVDRAPHREADEVGTPAGVVVPVDAERLLPLRDRDEPPLVEAHRVEADLRAVSVVGGHGEPFGRPPIEGMDRDEVVERRVHQERRRHRVVVAHQVVLVAVDRLVEEVEEAVVPLVVEGVLLLHLGVGRPAERLEDQVDAHVDREGHLVEAGRVERVEEAARVADAGPARRDELVEEVGKRPEVPAVPFDRLGVLEHLARERVRVEEARQLLEGRLPLGLDEARVPDEADARLPAAERDEPDPVAPAGEVVRGEAPRGDDAADERVGRVGADDLDAVEVLHVAIADPDRRRRVPLDRPDPAALPRQERLPPGGVDDPLRADGHLRPVRLLHRDRVPGRPLEGEVDDLRRPPDLGSLRGRHLQDVLVEDGAVELEPGRPSELRRPHLGRLAQAGDLLVVEPVAERLLGEVLAAQVVVELEDPRQEVGRDLDRRLPHLPVERLALLHDEDAQGRVPAAEEDGGGGAGDGAADDDDVVVPGLAHGSLSLNGDLFRPDHGRMIVKTSLATRNR